MHGIKARRKYLSSVPFEQFRGIVNAPPSSPQDSQRKDVNILFLWDTDLVAGWNYGNLCIRKL